MKKGVTDMAMETLYYITGGIVLIFILSLFFKPARTLLFAVLKTGVGFASLFLLNYAGQFIGLTLGINLLNSLLIGLLGIPGLGASLFLQWLY